MGVGLFVFFLLMLQMLRLTETVLTHDVGIRTVVHLMSYMAISFLPALLPMSLIFAIVLAYNRLTNNSEVIAFKSLGISMWPLVVPGLVLGLVTAAISAYMAFQVGPWGNRQFEVLWNDILNTKITGAIKEGTFSEGFADMVVYTNSIDPKTEELQNVFIYNERDAADPSTIVAEKGQIMSEKSFGAYRIFVRLVNGDIHKNSMEGHTKIHFDTYDFTISQPIEKKTRDKSLLSLNYQDLKGLIASNIPAPEKRKFSIELNSRYSLSAACLLFVLLGIGLGCRTHHRTGKSSGGVTSVTVIVIYWGLYVVGSNLSKNPEIPVWVGPWLAIMVMSPASLYILAKNWD